ncbi:MAG: ABC transporter substrate-binding protein [Defluviitaleaceae bacterium]|nr:ABC transporter substrate-binding protein [Defluviitaleaceae bacterium]
MKNKKLIAIIGLLSVALIFTACIDGTGNGTTVTATASYDREGYPIELPSEISTIISIGPSNTEILIELGFGDNIIYTDMFSDGIAPEIAVLDMMALDAEFVINANPDIVFVAGLTRVDGNNHPLQAVSDAGIAVLYIPTGISIAEIMEDIRFIASVMGVQEAGEAIVANMQAEIDAVVQIAETITNRRTVYFEISPAPWMFSMGGNTFQNEMLELVGAKNIFADQNSWLSVTDEMFLVHNPDVILTSTNFIDDPIGEILARPGWDIITAVQNGDVFLISTDASSRPSHNIVNAMWEIARAIYPEDFR